MAGEEAGRDERPSPFLAGTLDGPVASAGILRG